MTAWRDQLYKHYISSGMAPVTSEADFSSRAPHARRIIRNYLPDDRSTKIIDLGCGHGTYLYFLKEMGYQNIEGIDISTEQIDMAHKLGIDEAVEGDIFEYIGDTPKSSVGALLMIDVVEHLSRKKVHTLLGEAKRVLRPGGKCIIHTVNACGIFGMRVRYADLTHELAFTPSSINQILKVTGFEEVNVDEDKPVPHGFLSLCRRIIWDLGTLPHRILLQAESPKINGVLTANMIVEASTA